MAFVSIAVGNLSPLFTSNVSNPATDPSITFAAVNQNANVFYAGPATGSASAPTFRAIDPADIPVQLTAASKIFNYLNIF
jgi:hypothetical protein